MAEEKTIYETCPICKREVVNLNINDCPHCKAKFCVICKVSNDLKCPNCGEKLYTVSSQSSAIDLFRKWEALKKVGNGNFP